MWKPVPFQGGSKLQVWPHNAMCIVVSHTVQDVRLVEVAFWHDVGFPNHNVVVPLQVSLAVVVKVLVHVHTLHSNHGSHGHTQAFLLCA